MTGWRKSAPLRRLVSVLLRQRTCRWQTRRCSVLPVRCGASQLPATTPLPTQVRSSLLHLSDAGDNSASTNNLGTSDQGRMEQRGPRLEGQRQSFGMGTVLSSTQWTVQTVEAFSSTCSVPDPCPFPITTPEK